MPFLIGWLLAIHYYSNIYFFLHKILYELLLFIRGQFCVQIDNNIVESLWITDSDLLVYNLRFTQHDISSSINRTSSVSVETENSDEEYKVTACWDIVKMNDERGEDPLYFVGLSLTLMHLDGSECGVVDILMLPDAFFRFPLRRVISYLVDLAENDESDNAVLASDICRITGENSVVDVCEMPICFKTFWVSIIQRRWRKKRAEKRLRLLMRGRLLAQKHFELHGNYGGSSLTKIPFWA